MAILQFTGVALALLGSLALGAPTSNAVRASSAKVCDAATTICFQEFSSPQKVSYRIAIPDSATASAPYDVLLQIVAPKAAAGWAAVAWGGQMANNPLTIGWANDKSAVVSSRRATGHVAPAAYAGASYTVIPGSTSANDTHWTLTTLCSGCTSWSDATGKAVHIDPTSTSVSLAQAISARAPTTPSSNTSAISIHSAKSKFTFDLASAKIADFDTLVKAAIAKSS